MSSLGGKNAMRAAMWLYPKVLGFNPTERWGHSACYTHGAVYIFGVMHNFQNYQLLNYMFHNLVVAFLMLYAYLFIVHLLLYGYFWLWTYRLS